MSKKEDEKEVKEDVKTSKNTGGKEPLKTLVELVENSDKSKTLIMMELSRKNYLSQFYSEEKKVLEGFIVEPTMTETEFKKIIGD